jgi:hypothetical protein
MDVFANTTEILVLSLVGSTFAAMATFSVLDAIADHKVLMARFRQAMRSMPVAKSH